ncbi:MAG TPA: nicotinate-nucleotide adenylyltransferase [Alphaproteobacteria bacterium]
MLPPGRRRPRIGLLGGSFNPAHDGHRHVSRRAQALLGLDVVWWLVSPQNPLKPTAGMAPLAARLSRARAVAGHGAIRVTAIERILGTRYTVDTVAALKRRLPQARLVWLMGADNLIQMPRWHRWPALFHALPIAIFDRPTYSHSALLCPATRRFARYRRRLRDPARLVDCPPPAWAWIGGGLHPASATRIRDSGGWGRPDGRMAEGRSET